jgi:hypothetical protein
MKDLEQKTIQGGFARLCAQGASFFLRVGSLMVLAQLLGPKPNRARKCPPSRYVPWDALVRQRTEITLHGSSSRIEMTFTNKREELGFGLANEHESFSF